MQESSKRRSVRLIGHRGGAAFTAAQENTAVALERALDEGYWMIEVDLRATADGVLVVQHEPDLQRKYGVPGAIDELTWKQLVDLTGGEHRPLTFAEMIERCAGRARIMLDSKCPLPDPALYRQAETILRDAGCLDGCYCIGRAQALAYFADRCRTSRRPRDYPSELPTPLPSGTFLFGHAHKELAPTLVEKALTAGTTVVVSVNLQHYLDGDPLDQARQEVAVLLGLGVTEFQIDGAFLPLFDGLARERSFG